MDSEKKIVFEYRAPGGKVRKEPVSFKPGLELKCLGTVGLYRIKDGLTEEELRSETGLGVNDLENMAQGFLRLNGVTRGEMGGRVVRLAELLGDGDSGLAKVMEVLGLGKDGKQR